MAHLIRPRYTNGDGKTRKSKKWYGVLKDPVTGKRKRVPLCEDKTAAQAMLADLIREQDRAAAGLPTKAEKAAKSKPVVEHLAEWRASLEAKGASSKHIRITTSNATRVLTGVTSIEQISAAAVEGHLAKLAKQDYSIQTRNLHLASAKAFCNWLVAEERLPRNPLARLRRGNAKADRRHDRRAMTQEEFAALLKAAGDSTQKVRGVAGPDRRMLYLVAASTGFRVSELASLKPSSFLLEGDTPSVTCRASYTKNGKTAYQPLPPALVAPLREYLADKPADEPVWRGWWKDRASALLQHDLAAAGVEYQTEEGFADFHSLRTLFITGLFRAGVHPRVAQALARHSTITLTMETYTRVADEELARAAAKLSLPLEGAAG